MGKIAGVDGEPRWTRSHSINRKNIVFDVVTGAGLVSDVKRKSYGGRFDDVICL